MNKGEKDELLAKLALISLRDQKRTIPIPAISQINEVGFKNNTYRSHGKSLQELAVLSTAEIAELARQSNLMKAASRDKADVYINNKGFSLKSTRAAPPTYLNHTHRQGIKRVCDRENISISNIDRTVELYWNQRMAGVLTEDVNFELSPFKTERRTMVKLLSYFLFKGSATSDSKAPADYLISFANPLDFNTWKVFVPEDAANTLIKLTKWSMRAKGLPKTYSETSRSQRDQLLRPWIRNIQGKFKGSMHIRAVKPS